MYGQSPTNLGSESIDPSATSHFLKTMLFRRKFPENRDDVDTISSSSSDMTDLSTDSYDSEHERQLEREWEEGMEQLKLITTIVMLPLFGKWLGKKWAYLREFWTSDSRRAEYANDVDV